MIITTLLLPLGHIPFNYRLHHSSFKEIVQNAWNIPVDHSGSAKRINAKFKAEKKFETIVKKIILSQANNCTS
jgi:hypothetical protein